MIEIKPPSCIRCGYSLQGLPAAHACPECGLGFTANHFETIVCRFGYPRPLQCTLMSAMFIGCALNLPTVVIDLLNPLGSNRTPKLFLACILVIGLIMPIRWLLMRIRHAGTRWSITAEGVLISDFRVRLVAWWEIEAVYHGHNFIRLLLFKRSKSLRSPPFFRKAPDAEAAAVEIETRRTVALAATPADVDTNKLPAEATL